MWRDFLSSIGIGSVTVDTCVKKNVYEPGETIEGEVVARGGLADEPIEAIVLTLVVRHEKVRPDSDFSYHDREIITDTIFVSDKLNKKGEKRFPFSMTIPKDHQLTNEEYKTYLKTALVIPQAVDPSDEDEILVQK